MAAYIHFQFIFCSIYLWQSVVGRRDILELGGDFVGYLRNRHIKSALAHQQEALKRHGFLMMSYQRPASYRDFSSIRGGVNIPQHLKSAEIHYRIIKSLPECTYATLITSFRFLKNKIPILISQNIENQAEKRTAKRFRRFLRDQSNKMNGHPSCEFEYKIKHHRDAYAAIDSSIQETTELRVIIRAMDSSRSYRPYKLKRKGARFGNTTAPHQPTPSVTEKPRPES